MDEAKLKEQRNRYCAALCVQMREWYPELDFFPINAQLGWICIRGEWGADVERITKELGIKINKSREWCREICDWDFWITNEFMKNIANKLDKN